MSWVSADSAVNIGRSGTCLAIIFLMLCAFGPGARAAGQPVAGWPTNRPAQIRPQAVSSPLLAATIAGEGTGSGIVAVGDHGVILLSDDGNKYRQARSVPTRTMLTSVFFIDRNTGWAAGHDGVVLKTTDGGENWALLRQQYGQEQPILSIWFGDANNGLAVGLFGMALSSSDGGVTWNPLKLTDGDAADRHLYRIMATQTGALLIMAEAGTVFRSEDNGKHWDVIDSGEKGSLWSAAAFSDNGASTIVTAGMRGHIIRSSDDGKSWQAVASGTTQSLTDVARLDGQDLAIGGMGGTVLVSSDGGRHFKPVPGADDAPVTALLKVPGTGAAQLALFSMAGVIKPIDLKALAKP
jgi:photosystem II stability/assembly factor-like uncharacterized protein